MLLKTKIRPPQQWEVSALSALLMTVLILILVLGQTAPADTTDPSENTVGTSDPAQIPTLVPNPLSYEDFTYSGNYLTCLSGESVLGIDVSSHQKEINWQQVKAAGVEFVMIRVAYRGSIEGALMADDWAQEYYKGAKAAGLKVGAYIFTQSISAAEGVEDAEYAMALTKDWILDMPLVYDWEIIDESYRNGNLDRQTLTDTMLAFCRTVEKAGLEPMVYFNINNTRENFYLEQLAGYKLWLANYAEGLDFPYRIDMWQYTCTGSVPGIDGDVDIDLYFPHDKS